MGALIAAMKDKQEKHLGFHRRIEDYLLYIDSDPEQLLNTFHTFTNLDSDPQQPINCAGHFSQVTFIL